MPETPTPHEGEDFVAPAESSKELIEQEKEHHLRIAQFEGETMYYRLHADLKDPKSIERFAQAESRLIDEEMPEQRKASGLQRLANDQMRWVGHNLSAGPFGYESVVRDLTERADIVRKKYWNYSHQGDVFYLDSVLEEGANTRQTEVNAPYPNSGARAVEKLKGYITSANEDGRVDLGFMAFERKSRLREIRRGGGDSETVQYIDIQTNDPTPSIDIIDRLGMNKSPSELSGEVAELKHMIQLGSDLEGKNLELFKQKLPQIQEAIRIREEAAEVANQRAK